MTLPFRRRHHDAEGTHDRARALASQQMNEALPDEDGAWLTHHLEACTECRREREAFVADRALLRSLRDQTIEPPRDLWARTSAALDRESSKRPRGERRAHREAPQRRAAASPWRGMPLGAAAGVLVVLAVLGSAILPGLVAGPTSTSGVAVGTPGPGATPFDVAVSVPVLRTAPDGSWEVVVNDIDAVCPRARPECVPPPATGSVSTLDLLGAKPSTATISPHNDQLVFEAAGGTASEGKILVVPVPKPGSVETSPPTTQGTGSSSGPSQAPGSGEPTPEPTPIGQVEIASGVTVVGDVAYSADGNWLAFSAAPTDGSTGPDLYLWAVGSSSAMAVTNDHQTYFSAWLGDLVLASQVVVPFTPAASGLPVAPGGPGSTAPAASVEPRPIEGYPTSFLLDPATNSRSELTQPNVWLPAVDPASRFVAYWSGTLRSTDAITWQLGAGQLVLDGWSTGVAPAAEASASTAPAPSTTPILGPVGRATPIVEGQVADFRAKFDPDGIRLAVWVGQQATDTFGRLHLVVLDPVTGDISSARPLPGAPALRRFSIDVNGLAWVTPPGQDGLESAVKVLAWSDDVFGEIKTIPAKDLVILK